MGGPSKLSQECHIILHSVHLIEGEWLCRILLEHQLVLLTTVIHKSQMAASLTVEFCEPFEFFEFLLARQVLGEIFNKAHLLHLLDEHFELTESLCERKPKFKVSTRVLLSGLWTVDGAIRVPSIGRRERAEIELLKRHIHWFGENIMFSPEE